MTSKTEDDEPPTQTLGLPDPDHDPMYAWVRSALAGTGAGFSPKPGWETRVWAEIDGGAFPLLRFGRWPHGSRSALSLTGDIDALTIGDYAHRILGR